MMSARFTIAVAPRVAVIAGFVAACAVMGQPAGAQTAASSTGSASSPESLDTLVAPIALYPDPLLASILAASTYPIQIVEAARDTANGAKPTSAEMSQWDKSVQSLVAFPSVLSMMNNQLDWTTQLGQAVAQDQKAVMAAVQRVRAEAQKAGNLQSNDKQTVTTQSSTNTIVIEPANPQIIYVPQYNPVAIIEPAPVYAVAPAGYGLMTFGLGFAAGAMTAYACDWGHGGGSITVNNNYNYTNVNNTNVNRNTNVNNTNVNANKYSSWKAPTNVGHIGPTTASSNTLSGTHNQASANRAASNVSGTRDSGRGTGNYGSGERGADSYGNRGSSSYGGDRYGSADHGSMFGGANGGGWGSRAASDRGASSFGGGGFGHGFGGYGGGGGFHGGGRRF